ncbi:hypothetical protein RRF57_012138 [Xylaria bambusicola]|uniref:Carboxylic ester hydrolase n=1 Tax=Xylaria bambusicola TaxID=326684 RepID=A0AAN7ZDG7_9PEZI
MSYSLTDMFSQVLISGGYEAIFVKSTCAQSQARSQVEYSGKGSMVLIAGYPKGRHLPLIHLALKLSLLLRGNLYLSATLSPGNSLHDWRTVVSHGPTGTHTEPVYLQAKAAVAAVERFIKGERHIRLVNQIISYYLISGIMSLLLSSACVPATFDLSGILGLEVLRIDATLVTNYSASVSEIYRYTQPSVELSNATFCNVTVSYTHPGQNDTIHAEAWLPAVNWNSRFQAVGGGGYIAGRYVASYANMEGAIADGYATITTDAGVGDTQDPSPWALLSPGNVNLYNVQNIGSVSLSDGGLIGKSLIKSFYGKGPDYSYWNGCSQGGRQGMMLAQRYPTLYDGIAAGAPAIYWNELFASIQWPEQFMSLLGNYPYNCELDAINAAAVSACDELDGIIDGVITDVDACLTIFDPSSLVGTTINCTEAGEAIPISSTAAAVINATWSGPYTASGKQLWYGFNPGADITGNSQPPDQRIGGIAETNCTSGVCVGVPYFLSDPWFRLFVVKDPNFGMFNITHAQFDSLVHRSQQEYQSFLETEDPDLSEFRSIGGKLLSFHGLYDQIIPSKGTEHYYKQIASAIPEIDDFYRHFVVPGLGHCSGGRSGQPNQLFSQLRTWVENGTAPTQTSVKITGLNGEVHDRVLCRYSLRTNGTSQKCG